MVTWVALTHPKDLPLFDRWSTALPVFYPFKLHDHKIKSYRELLGASYYSVFCLLVECRLVGVFTRFKCDLWVRAEPQQHWEQSDAQLIWRRGDLLPRCQMGEIKYRHETGRHQGNKRNTRVGHRKTEMLFSRHFPSFKQSFRRKGLTSTAFRTVMQSKSADILVGSTTSNTLLYT